MDLKAYLARKEGKATEEPKVDLEAYIARKTAKAEDDKFQQRLAEEAKKVEDLKASKRENVGSSFARGIADSASFGLDDEIAAVARAGYDTLTSDKSFGDSYEANQRYLQSIKDQREEDNPGTNLAGQLFGGAAGGMGVAKGVQALTKGMGRAAKVGTQIASGVGEGALTGAASADADERLEGAKTGAMIGAGAEVVGPALKGAKKLLPGTKDSLAGANKIAAGLSIPARLAGAEIDDLEEFYSNPALRKLARKGVAKEQIDSVAKNLGDAMSATKKAASSGYEVGMKAAADELGDVSPEILNESIEKISANQGLYKPEAVRGVTLADNMLKGNLGVTKDMNPGERAIFARQQLRSTRKALGNSAEFQDIELLNKAEQQLSDVINKAPSMKQVDANYAQFKDITGDIDKRVFEKSPSGSRRVSKDKLEALGKSKTGRGTDFAKEIGRLEDFASYNPKLAENPSVKEAIDGLKKIQETEGMARLSAALDRTSSGLSNMVGVGMQLAIHSSLGPAAILALPVTNPAVWARVVDAAETSAERGLLEKISKAAPAVKSALVRASIQNQ